MNTDRIVSLRHFANSISIPLSNTDGIKWPIRSGEVIAPVNHIFASEYVRQIFQLSQDYNSTEWHNAFYNSLSLWRYSHHIINGLEKAGVKKSTISKFIATIMEMVAVLTESNDFTAGRHIILNDNIVSSFYQLPFAHEKQINLMLLRLSALLWAYSDSLYFQGREICCEYHGPYNWGNDNCFLLVRDFHNFSPNDLWPELEFNKSIHSIRIVTQHNSTLETYIDVYNNLNITKGSMTDSIVGGVLIVNGFVLDPINIHSLILDFSERLKKQTTFVNGMEKDELLSKYLLIFWYRKKALASFLNENWFPPVEVFDIIKKSDILCHTANPYNEIPIEKLKSKFDYSSYLNY